jgi:hypothetical protein
MMSDNAAYRVTIGTDSEGQFFKLPEGWFIEPENSDVILTHDLENGTYVVRPVIDNDGQPNCTFIFPATEAG